MGLYDTAINKEETIGVQLKAGPCEMRDYVEGDSVDGAFADGIYYGYEGVVVIKDGIIRSVTAEAPKDLPQLPSFNKWGGSFDPKTDSLDNDNPLSQALKSRV